MNLCVTAANVKVVSAPIDDGTTTQGETMAEGSNAALSNYADLDATAMAELVRKGEVKAEELVEQAIAGIEKVNPKINAVVHKMFDKARAQAKSAASLPDGPFKGVPFVVKDLDGFLANEPYTQGSRMTAKFVPDHDAEVVARMKKTGVVIVGKTNCPELGIKAVTDPELHGSSSCPR